MKGPVFLGDTKLATIDVPDPAPGVAEQAYCKFDQQSSGKGACLF